MMNLRRTTMAALGFVVALALTACGAPNVTPTLTSPSTAVVDTSTQDFTSDEALQASQLNQSGVLDTKEIAEFETALGRPATQVADDVKSNQAMDAFGFTAVAHLTQIGYVRTTEDGKFLLALKGNTKSYELTGSDGKRDARISGYLNHKVILRGIMLPSGKLMVQHILAIPTFKFVTDMFFKGRLAGNVFLAANKQGLVNALVTAKQGSTGFLFRTQTDRGGNFNFGGLDPDTYTVTVGLGGFKAVVQENVILIKGKKTSLMIPMNAN